MVMVQVMRKGSVLDAFMQRLTAAGVKVRSVWQSVDAGSQVCEDGEQNSLALRKPQKATQNAAHNVLLLVVVSAVQLCNASLRSLSS